MSFIERRIYDEATTFIEKHPIRKSHSWGAWQTCELCQRQERGFCSWMWKVPTPRPIPYMCVCPIPEVRPFITQQWAIYIGNQLVCRQCAPTYDDMDRIRKWLFWDMEPGEAARWVSRQREEAKRGI